MWFILTLLSAIFWALSDAYVKLSPNIPKNNTLNLIFFRFFFSLPVVLPFLPFLELNSKLFTQREFLILHIIWIPTEILALIFYIHSLRKHPLSLVSPLISLTPLFIVFTHRPFLKETFNVLGIGGITLIILGSFLLFKTNFPFQITAFFPIFTAFLYAITAVVGKKLVLLTNPLYFFVHYTIFMTITTGFLAKLENPFKNAEKYLIISGIFLGLSNLFHMWAVSISNVAYMISLKRTSGFFGVLLGKLLLKEEKIINRLQGVILIVLGSFLLFWG